MKKEYQDILDKATEFCKSEEGKQYFADFWMKKEKDKVFEERWTNKFIKAIQSKTDDELDHLLIAFTTHNNKRQDILFSQGFDGESSLSDYILDAFSEIGEICSEDKYGMFTTSLFKYKSFYAEMICGQGCFIKIYI